MKWLVHPTTLYLCTAKALGFFSAWSGREHSWRLQWMAMDLGYIEMPGRFSRFRWQTSGSYVWRPQGSPFFPKGVCFGHFFDKPIWKTNEFLEKCWCMPLLLCTKDHITGQLDSYQTRLAFKDLSVGHFITTCSSNFGGLTHKLVPTRGSIYLLIYACKMSHNLHYGSALSANMRYSAYSLHWDTTGYTSA